MCIRDRFTDFDVYPDPGGSGYDLQKVDYTFGGVGYYFNGGKAEPIRWKKGSPCLLYTSRCV